MADWSLSGDVTGDMLLAPPPSSPAAGGGPRNRAAAAPTLSGSPPPRAREAGRKYWGQALRRLPMASPSEDYEEDGGALSSGAPSSWLAAGSLLSLLGLWSPGKGSEDPAQPLSRPPHSQSSASGYPYSPPAGSAPGSGARPHLPFSVHAAPSADVPRGLPGTGSIPFVAPETMGSRVRLMGRRLALRCRTLRFLKRLLIALALALLLVPATWLGAPPPAPPPAPVLQPRDIAAEEAARDYAEFFSEAPADPAHCLGRFPTAPASEKTGTLYVAPSCTGGVGNQVSCAAAALAYALEFNRCLVLAKVYPAADNVRSKAMTGKSVPFEPPGAMRSVVFRHFWLQEHLLEDNVTSPFSNVGAEVQQPGLSMHYAPFRHPYKPDFWIAVLRGSFMHYSYTWEARKAVARYLRPPPEVTRALLKKYPDLARGVVLQVKRHNKEDHSDYTFPFIVRDFPLPSPFFYRQSLDMLLAAAPRKDLVYFVFSNNDYEWARTIPWLQGLPGPIVFVDAEDEINQFYMMMLARGGCICANQANCWWAAYLGVQPKPVYIPNHYYNAPGQEPMGILYPGDVTLVHSDHARGEGPPPWCVSPTHAHTHSSLPLKRNSSAHTPPSPSLSHRFPRPWEFSPLAGLNEPTSWGEEPENENRPFIAPSSATTWPGA